MDHGSVQTPIPPQQAAGHDGRVAQSAESGPIPTPSTQILMIAYDGSPNADRAIRYAARFLRARQAHVVTAWEPGSMAPSRLTTLAGGMQPFIDTRVEEDVDDALRAEATEINARGLAIADEAGLAATGSLVEVESTVWGALVAAADALQVDLLVTGTRGASGLKALLRSSVAERVLKHCHRPVFVVPAKCEDQPPVTL